jgi:hypothetical protein
MCGWSIATNDGHTKENPLREDTDSNSGATIRITSEEVRDYVINSARITPRACRRPESAHMIPEGASPRPCLPQNRRSGGGYPPPDDDQVAFHSVQQGHFR